MTDVNALINRIWYEIRYMQIIINPRNNYSGCVLSTIKSGTKLLWTLLSMYTTVPLRAVHLLCSAPDCLALLNTTNFPSDRRHKLDDRSSFRKTREERFSGTC